MGEQSRYQVRFDWGVQGAAAIGGDADVLVWVDALVPVAPPLDALPRECAVVATGLPGVAETAAWVLALQEARRARTVVAVVAAGADREGTLRFAAEDLLIAGALMDELETRGIDAMSPEAAVADAAYRTLRVGVRAMLGNVVGTGALAGGLRIHRPHRDLLDPVA
ncbi:2-phosphosulfolactate phosphatase [Amnibacterium sp.]|uniref:2-phosphosulfolactate phosphatase n=1 Tax=Amnibacterium sp. TaxID=1872496 RepID=UPI003F7C815E